MATKTHDLKLVNSLSESYAKIILTRNLKFDFILTLQMDGILKLAELPLLLINFLNLEILQFLIGAKGSKEILDLGM